ncbi:hypothetical protein ml_446 [Mollivirus sibericum]|uniref:hypothetical protein n=1 Tax=Mollivirus sibericum TaxID=1678078 RepID=UPI0006B2EE05|nr:hypothetical protein ml_446 [Mollivirus sibericum]ALD62248.1 hypothetical protein ml_446 [Mollivirus sibericum]
MLPSPPVPALFHHHHHQQQQHPVASEGVADDRRPTHAKAKRGRPKGARQYPPGSLCVGCAQRPPKRHGRCDCCRVRSRKARPRKVCKTDSAVDSTITTTPVAKDDTNLEALIMASMRSADRFKMQETRPPSLVPWPTPVPPPSAHADLECYRLSLYSRVSPLPPPGQ